MSYLMLSDQTRQHLEQERSRLMSDRSKIVSDIESSVKAEVDRAIQTLNALLNEAPVEVVPADGIVEAVTELLEHPPTETATKSLRARSREPKATRKTGTKKVKPEPKEQSAFDATQLKRKFKGKKPIDAIVQILQQDSEQIHTIDDLIAELYGKFDEAEMSRARKTLGATLMHATRAGTIERVGDKPSRFKLGQPAVVPA
ncbi:hypothetical protein NC981_24985 [Leptolyngbya sp. DQ-M1]|uniref:hypothetical protein n=1 Tax=Leptolyngbya sp. DQ-M1 TaxID=2933920 RepID=UPI00329769B1